MMWVGEMVRVVSDGEGRFVQVVGGGQYCRCRTARSFYSLQRQMIHAQCQCSCPSTYVLSPFPARRTTRASPLGRRISAEIVNLSLQSLRSAPLSRPWRRTPPPPPPPLAPSGRNPPELPESFLLQGQSTARNPPRPLSKSCLVSVRTITTCPCPALHARCVPV
jgi:hypothetical protein